MSNNVCLWNRNAPDNNLFQNGQGHKDSTVKKYVSWNIYFFYAFVFFKLIIFFWNVGLMSKSKVLLTTEISYPKKCFYNI